MSQRWTLRQNSCKPLCPVWSYRILAEIEVSQHWALRQHSCKTLRPGCTDVIAFEIEVSQRCAPS
jgi:hypothetical protein